MLELFQNRVNLPKVSVKDELERQKKIGLTQKKIQETKQKISVGYKRLDENQVKIDELMLVRKKLHEEVTKQEILCLDLEKTRISLEVAGCVSNIDEMMKDAIMLQKEAEKRRKEEQEEIDRLYEELEREVLEEKYEEQQKAKKNGEFLGDFLIDEKEKDRPNSQGDELERQRKIIQMEKYLEEMREKIDAGYRKIDEKQATVSELIRMNKKDEAERQLKIIEVFQEELAKQENMCIILEKTKIQLEVVADTSRMVDVFKDAVSLQKEPKENRDFLEDFLIDNEEMDRSNE